VRRQTVAAALRGVQKILTSWRAIWLMRGCPRCGILAVIPTWRTVGTTPAVAAAAAAERQVRWWSLTQLWRCSGYPVASI